MNSNLRSSTKLFLSLMITLLYFGCNGDVKAGQTAPDFILNDLYGNPVSLNQYKGNTVLLDFWATWCPPCRKSIPELVGLQKRYRDQGLVILGISMDNLQQYNNKSLLAFKIKSGINYTILRSNDKVLYDYFGNQRISIPTLFVVDREGKIVDKHVGFMPGAVGKALKKLF
ncbi:MAG: TlpA family protein disulfide reductase [Deltaproteobacteria bacterium]|nr:TlpA family protein disulfide reductase [Deltaproteobacteria bacterium]